MMTIPEEYVRLPGRFSDYYIRRDGAMLCSDGKPVHFHQTPDGYVAVTIRQKGGRTTTAHLHRMLAMAFVPNNTGRKVETADVNHINGDKTDNRLSNLEWVSRKANAMHAYRRGMRNDNVWMELHPDLNCKETWSMTHGDPLFFYSLSEAARFIGVSASTLHGYLNGPNYGLSPFHGWYISYCDNRSLYEFDSGDAEDPYNQLQQSAIGQGVENVS